MKRKFFGFSAKLALFLAAACGTLASCYEKEEITTTIDPTPKTVTYTISGSVYNYTSLAGINDASIVLSKDGTAIKTVTSSNGGQFYIALTDLKEANRGNYTLSITADGYKARNTNVTIWFEEVANQTIAVHMDIALKSAEIQGAPVEVVAGKETQVETIQGVDSQGNPANDVITFPANIFGGDVKTITFAREGASEEASNNAVRVYEGKPDGTTFTNPIEIKFTDKAGQSLKVFYEGTDGVWVIATGADANVVESPSGTYTAKIHHFSRIKFSASENNTSYILKNDSVPSTVVKRYQWDVAYYNNKATADNYETTMKKVEMGAKFVTPLTTVFAGLNAGSQALAIADFKSFWDAKYTTIAFPETNSFKVGEMKSQVRVQGYMNLVKIFANQNLATLTFTMNFAGKDYTIKVVSVNSYELEPGEVSNGHGTTAHGTDLNAGGGIVVSE